MKPNHFFAVAVCYCAMVIGLTDVNGLQPRTSAMTNQQHQAWVMDALLLMETIKPGMTRGDLMKVFQKEGGLSPLNESSGHYSFRDCMYFKVDVQFDPVGSKPTDADIIRTISRPYIERPILD